ncbi:MAG: ABC transporter ATP-binding protein [Chloroflexota bacterium]
MGYGKKHLFGNLNLTIAAGELVCLLGPNGTGKSTLLRTLTGLQPALSGEVNICGDKLAGLSTTQIATHLAVVLTERVEAGSMTAYELAALGRYPYTNWAGQLSASDHEVIRDAMRRTRCEALSQRNVAQLSDGERQRVMIARALVQNTPFIVLDEPTAFLDLPRRVETMRLLHTLVRETARAILVSTHELDLALRFADRLWLLTEDRQFIQGTPAELESNGTLAKVFEIEG